MKNNNNQEQKSWNDHQKKSHQIHENSLSKKVLLLNCQIKNSQKFYLTSKKPIKMLYKLKKSQKQSKNSQRNSQSGILSDKLILPDNLQNIQSQNKSNDKNWCNRKVKNVFEAYKQTLEYKYKKRIKELQRSTLKIDVSAMNLTEIQQRQDLDDRKFDEQNRKASKKYSNKKIQLDLDNNQVNSSNIYATISTRANSRLKSYTSKHNGTCMIRTTDDDTHNFIRSTKKYKLHSVNQDQYGKINIFQKKRKCHTEISNECSDLEFNKTKNITFRLPTSRKKINKSNQAKQVNVKGSLPLIQQKMKNQSSKPTISYRVKSLKNNYSSLCEVVQKLSKQNVSNVNQEGQLNEKQRGNLKYKRNFTLPIEEQNTSIFTQCQFQKQNSLSQQKVQKSQLWLIEKQNQKLFLRSNKKYKSKLQNITKKRNKKMNFKNNLIGQIDGWDISNDKQSEQCSFQPLNQYLIKENQD